MEELFAAYINSADDIDDEEEATTQKRKRQNEPSSTAGDESSADINAPASKKRKLADIKDIQLPTFIYDPEAEKAKEEEQRQKHAGRIRQVPHIKNNWPSLIFIPPPKELAPQLRDAQTALLEETSKECKDITLNEIPVADAHISLSKTFFLRDYEFDQFASKLHDAIRALSMPQFEVKLDEYQYYTNEEKTRSFVGLNVTTGKEEMEIFVGVINDVMQEFGRPKFFDQPKPHISLLWFLGDTPSHLVDRIAPAPRSISFKVDRVCLKISHRLFTFPLDST